MSKNEDWELRSCTPSPTLQSPNPKSPKLNGSPSAIISAGAVQLLYRFAEDGDVVSGPHVSSGTFRRGRSSSGTAIWDKCFPVYNEQWEHLVQNSVLYVMTDFIFRPMPPSSNWEHTSTAVPTASPFQQPLTTTSTFSFAMPQRSYILQEWPLLCPIAGCDQRTRDRRDMKRHLESEKHKEKSFSCDPYVGKCGKRLTRTDGAKRHAKHQDFDF
ncbi:unnamed protein product [Cyclocybe aegerita]|uniref:C2H2-type domain-containing protein n=1 Tax=Cyclocybe aegerita TaxID=1973307 RepID=A0A8S0W2F2_CYCAE|nr:unnamed protein product [Cyclocybe aegerita]